ncbi:MAG: hypothetical protein WBG17_14345, partial [Burkholderiaceae bacterium]
LAQLEAQSVTTDGQFDLFASAPDAEPAVEPDPPPATAALLQALDAIDPDALTPRAALDELYRLKQLREALSPP